MSKVASKKAEPTTKTAGKTAPAKKEEPAKQAAIVKPDIAPGIVPKKNPYHEMMITAEKIKTEKKTETKNVKTDFSFNPKNCIFLFTLCVIY